MFYNNCDEDGRYADVFERYSGWCELKAEHIVAFHFRVGEGKAKKRVVSSVNAALMQRACWSLKRHIIYLYMQEEWYRGFINSSL